MKLSEAIRLGSMLKPQVRGVTRSDVGTCALGAALDAIGSDGTYVKALDFWPVLRRVVVQPASGEINVLVISAIRMLNDTHRWTREAIADWVATIEPQDVPQPVEAPAEMLVEA